LRDEDGRTAAVELDHAAGLLKAIGARNELALTWLAQAALQRTRDPDAAGALAERARTVFVELGTRSMELPGAP
jgi:hypothetical protein